jgi:hypothetical protein
MERLAEPDSSSGDPVAGSRLLDDERSASYLAGGGLLLIFLRERQDCILTNEIYTTSLSIPVQEHNITSLIGNTPARPRCLVIIDQGLYSTVNSNVSSFGFAEPYFPYSTFSPSAFYRDLNKNSNMILSTGEQTIYYS